jgi:hypothetical protein
MTSTGEMAAALRALADELDTADIALLPRTRLVLDVQVSGRVPMDESDRVAASQRLGAAFGVAVGEYGHGDGFRHHGTPGQRRHGVEVSIFVPLTTTTGGALRAA